VEKVDQLAKYINKFFHKANKQSSTNKLRTCIKKQKN